MVRQFQRISVGKNLPQWKIISHRVARGLSRDDDGINAQPSNFPSALESSLEVPFKQSALFCSCFIGVPAFTSFATAAWHPCATRVGSYKGCRAPGRDHYALRHSAASSKEFASGVLTKSYTDSHFLHPALRHLYPQILRRGAGTILQLPARHEKRVKHTSSANVMRVGPPSKPSMVMEVSPEVRSSDRH